MKTETIVMFAIAGFGLWYLIRGQTASAQTVKLPFPDTPAFSIDTAKVQANFDAVRAARASAPPLRTATTVQRVMW